MRMNSYPIRVKTYPLVRRNSKVRRADYIEPNSCMNMSWDMQSPDIPAIAREIVKAYHKKSPVIVIHGAHLVKSGLSLLLMDLAQRGIITLLATHMASAIHSFELALIGESSENVPQALPQGEFGMAFETGVYLNQAMTVGDRHGFGLGESMARFINDTEFRKEVLDAVFQRYEDNPEYIKPYEGFPYASDHLLAGVHRYGIPVTIHAMIGTDITDQHDNFDGAAKGSTSARDFTLFREMISQCSSNGGVVLNIGSAVMGPEVLLKAVSVAINTRKAPHGLVTATFDIRPILSAHSVGDENNPSYYFRDQKSITYRIPESVHGTGYYVQGTITQTIPQLYKEIILQLK